MCIFHRYCQIVLGSAVLPTSTIDIWDYFYTVCQGFRHLLNKPAHKNTVFRVGRIKVWRGLEELWHHRSSFLKHSFTWLCQVLVAACEIFSCDVWTLSCSMWDLVPQPGIKSRSPALGVQSLSHYFFNLFIFNWRIIALQCCVGLCQASTWITHRYTSLLNLPSPSHLPPFKVVTEHWVPQYKQACLPIWLFMHVFHQLTTFAV